MGKPIVQRAGQEPKYVKNLGWILRNWQDVESIRFQQLPGHCQNDGIFIASLRDGGVYATEYASFTVFLRWVNRPVFKGVDFDICPVTFRPYKMKVGDDTFKQIQKMRESV